MADSAPDPGAARLSSLRRAPVSRQAELSLMARQVGHCRLKQQSHLR